MLRFLRGARKRRCLCSVESRTAGCVDVTASLLRFQGMGEPMHNLDNVIRAVDVMVHQQGLHVSHKKVHLPIYFHYAETLQNSRDEKGSLLKRAGWY